MAYITIAQYRGRSFVSWLIKKQTRSIWSHSAAVLQDGSVIEAWHVGGVSHVADLSVNHSKGTQVDLFRIECTQAQADKFEELLKADIGKKYDFRSVFRFLSKHPSCDNDKWFCSEEIDHKLRAVGIYTQNRICSAEMSPQLLGISIMLDYLKTVVTV